MGLSHVVLLASLVSGPAPQVKAASGEPAAFPRASLAAFSAAAGLAEPPDPATLGSPPNPLLAGVLTASLAYLPCGVVVGYAYAGDAARGWQAVRWQFVGSGVGTALGLAAAPVLIWSSPPRTGPHGNAFDMLWWVVAPSFGAVLGHWLVGLAASIDAYDVAKRHDPRPVLPDAERAPR